MTEDELVKAVVHFGELCRQDSDVAMMRNIILANGGHESIGHFCRADPQGFIDLYDSALAMVGLDSQFDQYIEMRGTAHAKEGE